MQQVDPGAAHVPHPELLCGRRLAARVRQEAAEVVLGVLGDLHRPADGVLLLLVIGVLQLHPRDDSRGHPYTHSMQFVDT